jgi:hypothetical protein
MPRPYRPIATDHRKGAMKAALELQADVGTVHLLAPGGELLLCGREVQGDDMIASNRDAATCSGCLAAPLEGALEPPRRRPDPVPVEATSVRDLAAKLAEKAMRALEEDMDYGEPRERQEAARTLAVVCAKLMGDEPEAPAAPTPEERKRLLRESFSNPDPELVEVMREMRDRILEVTK